MAELERWNLGSDVLRDRAPGGFPEEDALAVSGSADVTYGPSGMQNLSVSRGKFQGFFLKKISDRISPAYFF